MCPHSVLCCHPLHPTPPPMMVINPPLSLFQILPRSWHPTNSAQRCPDKCDIISSANFIIFFNLSLYKSTSPAPESLPVLLLFHEAMLSCQFLANHPLAATLARATLPVRKPTLFLLLQIELFTLLLLSLLPHSSYRYPRQTTLP